MTSERSDATRAPSHNCSKQVSIGRPNPDGLVHASLCMPIPSSQTGNRQQIDGRKVVHASGVERYMRVRASQTQTATRRDETRRDEPRVALCVETHTSRWRGHRQQRGESRALGGGCPARLNYSRVPPCLCGACVPACICACVRACMRDLTTRHNAPPARSLTGIRARTQPGGDFRGAGRWVQFRRHRRHVPFRVVTGT